jgi:dihydroorotase
MSCRPAQLHGLNAGTLKVGTKADIAIIDLEYPWVYAKNEIVSKSKNSAFEDARFTGKVIETIVSGKTVYSDV